jgi:outer membrane protein
MNISRFIVHSGFALILSMLFIGSAQAAEKIGFVDLPRLLQDSPQRQEASARVEKEFASRKQKIDTLAARIKSTQDELKRNSDTMSASQVKNKESGLLDLQRELKREQQYFNEDLSLRNNQELKELQNVIFKTIAKVAKREGYDLVMAEGIAYYSDKVNITSMILDQLKKDFKAK